MAKAESRYNQITKEPQEMSLTSRVCKPLSMRRNWLYAAHIISGKYKGKTKLKKPTISISEIHNTYKGSAISFFSRSLKKKEPTHQKPSIGI